MAHNYKINFLRNTSTFNTLLETREYLKHLRDTSTLSTFELLFELRIYRWNTTRRQWIELDLLARWAKVHH